MSDEKKGLKTWLEWDDLCKEGLGMESSKEFPFATITYWRDSEIECPHSEYLNGRWKTCKAKLKESNITIECGTEFRRVMRCEICSTFSCRQVGRTARG